MQRALTIAVACLAAVPELLAPGLSAAPAASTPQPFAARYSGVGGLVEARVTLTRSGRFLKYEYRSTLAGYGFYECSIVETGPRDFWPLNYVHHEIQGDGKRDIGIVFERAQRRATLTRAGERRVLEDVEFPVWDALSVQLRMMVDLAAGQAPLKYRVIDKGGLIEYRFRQSAGADLRHDGRDYRTLRIERDELKPKSYVELAPELRYVPVRIAYNARVVGWVSAALVEFAPSNPQSASGDAAAPQCEQR
jgi:hypothetical protein